MFTIIVGAILLSALHSILPNHWLTIVAISKAEKWKRNETLFITFLAGITHTITTIIIGILIGYAGWQLSQIAEMYMKVIAPLILSVIGVFYIVYDLSGKGSHRHCCHSEGEEPKSHRGHFHPDKEKYQKGKIAVVVSLLLAMFFSPCLEIEAFYFTAAKYGWQGILSVSVIYLMLSTIGMVTCVYLGLKGIEKLKFKLLQHHERLVSGIMLVLVSLLVYFVEI